MHKITRGSQIRYILTLLLLVLSLSSWNTKENDNPITITSNINDATCPGGNDGSITVTPAGGIGPYTFSWVGPLTFTATGATISNLQAGAYTVTITDSSTPPLITTPASITITDADLALPVITNPGAISLNASEIIPGFSLAIPATSDNCGVATVTNDVTTLNLGVNSVNWIATDLSGNITDLTQSVTVSDDIAPVITCPTPSNPYNSDSGSCFATLTFEATATDNSGSVSISYSVDGNSISFPYDFPIGSTIVRAIADDGNGQTAECNFTVVVEDNEAPEVTCPTPASSYSVDPGECNATLSFTATATDNCDTNVALTYSVAGSAITFPYDFPVGTTTVLVTADDGDVNSANDTCTFSVIVIDDEAPIISCPTPAASYSMDPGECTATLSFNATATDNCDTDVAVTYSIDGSTITFPYDFQKGTTTVVATANDGDENSTNDTCSFEVTVVDSEAPVISCVASGTKNTNAGTCTYTIIGTEFDATFTDNCISGSITNNYTDTETLAGAIFEIGDNVVIWTVDDGNGQTATCSTTITVQDNEIPVLNCVADDTRNTDAGDCTYTIVGTEFDATFTDNCTSGSITNDYNNSTSLAGAIFDKGDTEVTWTVDDGNGQSVICSTIITIEDNEDPVITCVVNSTRNTDAGDCTYTVVGLEFDATFTDNCTDGSITNNYNNSSSLAGAIFDKGDTIVTWTVDDGNGQTATCDTKITIEDNEIPVINCVADGIRNTDTGDCTYTIVGTEFDATFTDNCNDGSITNNFNNTASLSGEVFNEGETTVTWTVNDGNGQSVICSTIITVEDNEAPTMNCISNKSRNADNGECFYTVQGTEFDPFTLADNCNVQSLTNDYNGSSTLAGEQISNGTTILWTLTDSSSNIKTCSFTLTVIDNQLPLIPELPPLSAECNLTVTPPTTTDNCDGIVTATTGTDLTFEESGSIFWIFTDAAGNSTEPIEQVVTIDDTQAPVPDLESLPSKSITGCQISSISELDIPTATDVCDGVITGRLGDGFDFPYSFYEQNTITWEFIDEAGNISTQQQEIILNPIETDGGVLKGTFNTTEFDEQIDISSCGASIDVDLAVSGQIGTIVRWEKFAVNEGSWEYISNTTANYTASFASGDLESTYYRVLVQNGTCLDYSNSFYIRALPAGDAPTVTNLDEDNKYCLGEDVNLLAESNYYATQPAIPSGMSPGDFNQGQLNTQDEDSWLTDGKPGGFTAGGNSTTARNWSGTNDHKFGDITYDGGDGKFAIAQGDFSDNKYKGANPTTLESPILDFTNAASATLQFDQAFYFADGDVAIIEVSTDGGATYPFTLRLMHGANSGSLQWFYADTAESTAGSDPENYNFSTDNTSISLDDYVGESEVRIRWSFTGTSDKSVWAMDNIFISNQVLVETELEWTKGIGDPDENPIESGETSIPLNFIPNSPGAHQYGATALINGCRTYDEDGTDLINILVSYSYAGEDIILTNEECGQNTVQLNAYDNSLTANENAAKGAYPGKPENCITCDSPGTGDIGTWSWAGATPSCTDASFSDINDPDAIFTAGPGEYILTWTVDGCSHNVAVTITNCTQVDFDGNNDHVDFGDNFDLSGAFSLEVWVKPSSLDGIRTIFSKRDAAFPNNAKGYDLRIENGKVSFNWDKTGSIKSPVNLPNTNRWYHIALTHTSTGEYKLYIDGILMKLTGGNAPGQNDYNALIGAMDHNDVEITSNFFHGWIEEFRIWNVALNKEQLHLMMNQRIEESGSNKVKGEILPLEVSNLNWSNLAGYYRMDNISCGNLFPFSIDGTSLIGVAGKLRNITSAQERTAPLPYISKTDGSWRNSNTWLHSDVWTWPNDDGINGEKINWNIAVLENDIFSDSDIYLLGLISNSGTLDITGNVAAETGQGLTITKYLDLDGVIDLNGNSQLIQTEGSILEENSSGYIDIDQQGTANSFNYNYWSSPVSEIDLPNNNGFILENVLLDGTDPDNPEPISFNGQYHWADGNYTGAKRISSYWLYNFGDPEDDFNGDADDYFSWSQFDHTEKLPAGIGYTMKGTTGYVPISTRQNYTFRGKPNNGDISVTVAADQNLLTGNPYPSAIDALKFINDNLNGFNGALYFWDHFGKEDTHYLEEYVGGYAVYNKSGGISSATSIDSRINNNEESSDKDPPGQFIPVGQAFFINTLGVNNPLTITYKNEYRAFILESEKDNNGNDLSQFHSQEKENPKERQNKASLDERYKIRLKYESPKGYHRQILVTADENSTGGFDLGYDAPLIENNVEDMYWMVEDTEFVIQAVPDFAPDRVLPLGIKVAEAGEFTIKIDKTENMKSSFEIFLKDKSLNEYYKISEEDFTTSIDETGFFNERFELVFRTQEEDSEDDEEEEEENEEDNAGSDEDELPTGPEKPELEPQDSFLNLDYYKNSDEIALINPDLINIELIEIYSVSGQKIMTFEQVPTAQSVQLQIKQQLSSAVYFVKLYSEGKIYTKKIIITR